jgi:hypothetical protein
MKEIQKSKTTKLQTYRGQFEQLKMKEDEDIVAYFLRVDEIVNAIIGLGEEIKESVIVQKVLRSLPMRFNPKISTLEERSDLDSISMDELHGIFTAYEMRIEQENPDVKEEPSKHPKDQIKIKRNKKNIAATVTSRKMMKKWPTSSKDRTREPEVGIEVSFL